ncbi:hypothetical protein I2485_05825 [Nesterenkonia sp. E16_7]|uniref:hypothetical protein n=1 Tax=unclassified Nesterenkonia TaxID=2629769 RepID=UPI001A91D9E6|nr:MULTISPECIES: hypothetical protein [unclassified Nesterenkonia]MBO0596879.1 hypothetical protein [Nesterenkonia sp. E16_10]MBO0598167.1 hypothetical protein [Nesterenkonia sp. E16_7]
MTPARPRLPRISAGLIAVLLLGACGADPQETAPDDADHAGVGQGAGESEGAGESDDAGESGGAGENVVEGAAGLSAPDRLIGAAAQGAQRAASFGFTEQGFVSDEVASSYRELLEENSLAGEDPEVQVSPESCARPLAAVDFSPLLLGEQSVRADYFAESFSGAGSIELATLEGEADRERVAEHLENVAELLESCQDTEFTLDGLDYVLRIEEPDLQEQAEVPAEQAENTAAYSWQRTGDDGTTHAQILFTQVDDDIIMVSFTGGEAAGSAEFTSIAEAIAAEASAALGTAE